MTEDEERLRKLEAQVTRDSVLLEELTRMVRNHNNIINGDGSDHEGMVVRVDRLEVTTKNQMRLGWVTLPVIFYAALEAVRSKFGF
jgi:uncharacterized coiled-coil protein SlyX